MAVSVAITLQLNSRKCKKLAYMFGYWQRLPASSNHKLAKLITMLFLELGICVSETVLPFLLYQYVHAVILKVSAFIAA